MTLAGGRAWPSLCFYQLTIALLLLLFVAASIGSEARGVDPSLLQADRARLERLADRLSHRREHDVMAGVYPEIDTKEMHVERTSSVGQSPRVLAILDELRRKYEARMNENPGLLMDRLSDFALLESTADLTGAQQPEHQVGSPLAFDRQGQVIADPESIQSAPTVPAAVLSV